MISNHIVSSGVLPPVLFLHDIWWWYTVMKEAWRLSVLIWHCTTQIIVVRNFWLIFSYPSSSPSSSLLSLQIVSPLFILTLSSPHPLLSFLPLLTLSSLSSLSSSSTLSSLSSSSTPFPPFPHPLLSSFSSSPIVSPFSLTWQNLKLHVSTVYYYHPLECRSNLLVLKQPV